MNPDEYICLSNLSDKFNIQLSIDPKTGLIIYCGIFYCDDNGSMLILQITNNAMSNLPIMYSDIQCFPNLNELNLVSFVVSKELFFHQFTKRMKKISFIEATLDFTEIDQKISPCDLFFVSSSSDITYTIKLSYIANIGAFISLIKAFVVNDISPFEPSTNLTQLIMIVVNFPNFSSLTNLDSLTLYLDNSFDLSTQSNYSTIGQLKPLSDLFISHVNQSQLFPNYFKSGCRAQVIKIEGMFEKPSSMIDISHFRDVEKLELQKVGPEFNYQGRLPIIPNPSISLSIDGGNFSVFPPPEDFHQNTQIRLCGLTGKLPIYTGTGLSYDYSVNELSGTIDPSWCSTKLNVYYNKLYGSIPSCFACYLSESDMFASFAANSFDNFNPNLQCSTFSPRVSFLSNDIKTTGTSTFEFTGIDIGFYPEKWQLLNSTGSFISSDQIEINSVGKNYSVHFNSTFSDNYFSIQFLVPLPSRIYTFPTNNNSPLMSKVNVVGDKYTVNGTYFSTYLGYTIQNVTIISNLISTDCLVNKTSFFSIDCQLSSTSSVLSGKQILMVQSDSLIGRVYINTDDGFTNDITCPNNCKDIENQICDLSTGNCAPWFECQCGTFGKCDHTTGKCICDVKYQGDDCTIPILECPNNCSGNGVYCNTITGVCSCNDRYTSDNCSIPNHFISAIVETTTEGGEALFFGWFGEIHNGITLTIGGKNCYPITFNSSNEIRCIAPPGQGIHQVILSQNGIEYTSTSTLYKYSEIVKKCPNDCTNPNQGKCNTSTGDCNCINGYSSFDCSVRGNGGGTNSSVDPNTGGSNLNNKLNFEIYLKSLLEINFNGEIVNQYSLQSNWTYNKTEIDHANKFTFSQTIQNSTCTIVSKVEEITNQDGKEYSFAGSNFKLEKGSIKYSISIENYKYQSNLNTLQLLMVSSLVNDDQSNNNCNEDTTKIDTHNDDQSSFNYIKMSKDNKVFTGRFINRLLSDGRPTNAYLSTSVTNDNSSITVSLKLPRFEHSVLIDPDYSLLVDTSFKSKCESKSRKWLIPVVVVVPVIGLALLITTAVLIYKKRNESKFSMKMKSLNKT